MSSARFPAFFDQVPRLVVRDPLADFLGAAEGGVLDYGYADAVRTGQPCCAGVVTARVRVVAPEIEAALAWCSATAAERDYTGALAGLDKFSWEGHCMYCGHCAPCSVGINIAGVNKYYNLTLAQHEIPETVREHYRLLPHHASECIACGRCERNCPFGVDIIGHMRLAAAKFGY